MKASQLKANEIRVQSFDGEPDKTIVESLITPNHGIFGSWRKRWNSVSDAYQHKDKDYYIPAVLVKYSIEGIGSLEFLKICVDVSEKADDPKLFEVELIYAEVTRAWMDFGLHVHMVWMGLYFVLMAAITLSNYSFHNVAIENEPFMKAGLWALIALIILLSFLFALFEMKQAFTEIKDYKLRRYLEENMVDWLAYSLTLTGCFIRCINFRETPLSSAIMSVATLFVFLKGLLLLRPFKSFGPTIRMVFAIFEIILPLIGILAVVNFGFAQSFYLLSYQNPEIELSDPYSSGLSTFIFMTGQADWNEMQETSTPALALFLMCLFITLSTILILNLVIAKMNYVYSMVEDNRIGEWKREQCKLVLEHTMLGFQDYFSEQKKCLCVLMRKEDLDARNAELRERSRGEDTQNIAYDIKGEIDGMKQQLESLRADVKMLVETLQVR